MGFPPALLATHHRQGSEGMGDTELGAALDELEATLSPVDPRVVDELLGAGVLRGDRADRGRAAEEASRPGCASP